jgi:hypothetical protein
MALTFELELNHGAVSQPILGHEPCGKLWLYCIESYRLQNYMSPISMGHYEDIIFKNKPQLITTKEIRGFSIKHLPGYGAFVVFTLRYRASSFILIPIHNRETLGRAPSVTVTPVEGGFKFDIASDEKFECYRIEFYKEYFCEEYIVYGEDGIASITINPELGGELLVVVTGYSNEISLRSEPWEDTLEAPGRAPLPNPFGATKFTELTDVPSSYDDMAGKILDVKSDETGLKFTDKKRNYTVTLVDANWSSNEQTVAVDGLAEDDTVIVAPTPNHQAAYVSAGIICIAQGADSLTFACSSVPAQNINVNVVVL